MKKYLVLGLFAVSLGGVSGCGGGGADGLMKDQIAAMNEISSSLESIKDDASADAAMTKIDKTCERMKEITKKLNDLKVPEAEQKKIMESNKKAIDEAGEKMKKAMESAVTKAPSKGLQIAGTMMKMAGAMMEGKGK